MCVALFKPSDKILTKETLSICNQNNPDGSGFAYIQDGKIVIKKGFFDFEEFWSAFNEIQNGNQCLVHFRIATAGLKDGYNCHPWKIGEDIAMMHNGTISDFQNKDSKVSDTGLFAENILTDLAKMGGHKFFVSPTMQYLIYKVIGDSSKLVFMDKDGEVQIFNEHKGTWHEGIWFSNTSFKEIKSKENKSSKNSSSTTTVKKGKSKVDPATSPYHCEPYMHFIGKMGQNQKFGYVMPGSSALMTQNDINKTVKKFRTKLKILVERGEVIRVKVKDGVIDHGDGEEGLRQWLAIREDVSPHILSKSIA